VLHQGTLVNTLYSTFVT